jgi:cell division protease FtsH
VGDLSEHGSDDEAREFAAAFRGLLNWVHATASRADNEVVVLVREFLGPERIHHSVVTRALPAFEHVNLQTAVDAWSRQPGRTVEVRGVAMPPLFSLSLQQLVVAEGLPPLRCSMTCSTRRRR